MSRADKDNPIPCQKLKPWKIWRESANREILVDLRVIADKDGSIRFIATAVMPDGSNVRRENTDAMALWREMNSEVGSSAPLTWQKMLAVKVHDVTVLRMDDDDDGAGLTVKFEPIEIAKAGRLKFNRRFEGAEIKKGWPRVGSFEHSWGDSAHSSAMIPDTPENRAALAKIVSGIRDVSSRIRKLMSPELIESTIVSAVSGSLLLTDQSKDKQASKAEVKK